MPEAAFSEGPKIGLLLQAIYSGKTLSLLGTKEPSQKKRLLAFKEQLTAIRDPALKAPTLSAIPEEEEEKKHADVELLAFEKNFPPIFHLSGSASTPSHPSSQKKKTFTVGDAKQLYIHLHAQLRKPRGLRGDWDDDSVSEIAAVESHGEMMAAEKVMAGAPEESYERAKLRAFLGHDKLADPRKVPVEAIVLFHPARGTGIFLE
jgi:hypothetical protein